MLEIIGKYCKIYKAKVDCYCMFGLRKSHRNASVQIFSRIFVYIHACYRELMDIVSSGKFCKSLEGFEIQDDFTLKIIQYMADFRLDVLNICTIDKP